MFSSIKHCAYREKMSSESVNLIAFISAIYKTKIGKIKTTKTHSNETMPEKTGTTEVQVLTYFQIIC